MQDHTPLRETAVLEGKYALKDTFGSVVPPEFFSGFIYG